MVFANDDWTGNKTDRKSNTDYILLPNESPIVWKSKYIVRDTVIS